MNVDALFTGPRMVPLDGVLDRAVFMHWDSGAAKLSADNPIT